MTTLARHGPEACFYIGTKHIWLLLRVYEHLSIERAMEIEMSWHDGVLFL
jgi:hypothetical protein